MSREFSDYEDDMADQFVQAGYRRLAQKSQATLRPGQRFAPAVAVFAAIAVVVTGTLAWTALRPQPVSASVFEITIRENQIDLAVVDLITQPGDAETQLSVEAKISAELRALPVPQELVGAIIGVGTSDSVEPIISRAPDGSIDHITLLAGFSGSLLIEFGRAADPGETFVAMTEDQSCSQLWGFNPAEALGGLTDLAPTIRYETLNEQLLRRTDVPLDEIDPQYQLASIQFLDTETVIVLFVADLSNHARPPACG